MVPQTKGLENAMVGEGGVGYTCAVWGRLDMFLVLFAAGKRGRTICGLHCRQSHRGE